MPAKSKAQQMAAGAALSAKRGENKKRSQRGVSKQMYGSMSTKELQEMASSKHGGKPYHKKTVASSWSLLAYI